MNKPLAKMGQKVYHLYNRGYGSQEIANKLGVSIYSVYNTQSRINKKGYGMEFGGMSGRSRRTYTIQEKINHVLTFKGSGLNCNAYVTKNDLYYATLAKWVKDYDQGILKVENGISVSRKVQEVHTSCNITTRIAEVKKEVFFVEEELDKISKAIDVIKGLEL